MISRLKELFSEKNESAKKGFLKKGFSKSGFQKKEFHKREGSSLISVIIGVVFLSAIGLTVLTVASRYAVTTIVDRNSADNFYQTEGILEEIRTGLLEKAGDASEKAYTEILENYTSEKGSMKEKYAKEYLSGFVSALMNDSITYDPKNIDDNLGKLQECSDKTLDLLKSMTRVPDAVKVKENTKLKYVFNYDKKSGYSMTLKNLIIDYINPADYRSTIDTDIVFRVPDYKFQGDSTLDELKDYIVISDDTLSVADTMKPSFTGSIYTGNFDEGIRVGTQSNVTFAGKDIISRGNLNVYTGANVSLAGESGTAAGNLWLQNICLKPYGAEGSSLSTQFTMNENAYIANDLDIEDNNATVTLAGKYYGYSYNKENDGSSTEMANADYSSAILVNGMNTTINGEDLDKMILAGRAFVDQNDKNMASASSSIMTGESMSVRSNQLAYLVPDSFVESNPMATGDFSTIENSLKTSLKDDPVLGPYLKPGEPYTANYSQDGYVFLFLNFASEQKANEYFRDYFDGTLAEKAETNNSSMMKDEEGNPIVGTDQLRERAETYLTSATNMNNNKFSSNLYLIAGNIVYNYDATDGGPNMQAANYYDGSGKPQAALLADGKGIALNYLGKCLTLLNSGSAGRDTDIRLHKQDVTNSGETVVKKDPPLVSDKIIDVSKIESKIANENGSEFKKYSDGKFIVAHGNYNISSPEKGLLVATGDVTVNANFEGLILCCGKVTVNGNCELKHNMIMVGNILEEIEKDTENPEYAKFFKAFNGEYTEDPTALEDCVSYQNWVKNG